MCREKARKCASRLLLLNLVPNIITLMWYLEHARHFDAIVKLTSNNKQIEDIFILFSNNYEGNNE